VIRRAGAVALLTLLSTASTASAYVRTRSSVGKGRPSAWPSSCVFIQPDSDGSPDLSKEQTFSVIQKSIANWNDTTSGCSYLKLLYDEPTSRDAHYDGFNMVKFRTDRWCHPDDQTSKGVCYSAQAAAITSVFMINDGGDRDGLILDADIEMNGLNFTFVIVEPGVTPTPRPNTDAADLENTLTHEIGHLLGLSHTCRDDASFPNDVDQDGNPPPSCDALSSLPMDRRNVITGATMFNFAQPGETKKRSVEADDVAGVCAAYPIADVGQRTCERTDLKKLTTRGCSTEGPVATRRSDGGGGGGGAVTLAGLFLLVVAGAIGVATRRRRLPR
jgi:hypothetical protein